MSKLADFFGKLLHKFMPNAFIFALLLTFVVFIAGLFVTSPSGEENSIYDLCKYWGQGFWGLLGFAMQMALIVATGTALSTTPVISKVLDFLAFRLDTPAKAVVGTAFFTGIACWLQYGFGLVFGALLARKVAQRVEKGLCYPLLVAAAYSGFLLWHGGLSGSIPLTLATPGADKALVSVLGKEAALPLSQSIFSVLNLSIVGTLLVLIPLSCYLMMPKKCEGISKELKASLEIKSEKVKVDKKDQTLATYLENSVYVTFFTCLLGFGYVLLYLLSGKGMSLNTVLFIFLFLGLALHKTPANYINAFKLGVRESTGIILQFPFYAGIMGIMTASGLGLAITQFFVNIADARTLPLWTFLVSGIVNFFVPSGGGQWAVQSHFVLNAASSLHANISHVVMAVAWGDAWTNMVQPFWALPLLSVAKLNVRDILGYTTPILLISGVVITSYFYIFY